MINKISLKNFKAFENAEFEIKPITILVGPNNGGKSSFIQSILLIQQTLKGSGKELLSLNELNLGDFEGVVNQKSKAKEMGFKFDFDDDDNRTYIDFTIAMGKDTNLFVKNFSCNTGVFEYILNDMNIEKDLYRPQKFKINPNIFEKYHIPSLFFEPIFYRDTFFLKFRSIGELTDLFEKIYIKPRQKEEEYLTKLMPRSPSGIMIIFRKLIDFLTLTLFKKSKKRGKIDEEIEAPPRIDEETRALRNVYKKILEYSYDLPRISNDFYEQKIKTEFNNINYIGPIREKAQRLYEIGSFDYVGSTGQHAVQMIAADHDLEDRTQNFLRKLEIADALQVSKKGRQRNFEFKFKTKIAEEVNFTDLGCGTSQILPILVQCLCSKDESMTIIEQPEVHLHPKVQADLADFFIKFATPKTRFLIETHSDYFVERIRMGIMREDISNENVAIYYIEQNKKKKCATVTKIEINEMGQYSKLPDGYLTNIGLKEIKDQTDLMLKKLLKETSTK